MADKEIVNLPAAPAFYDDAMIVVYVPGSATPAQKITGAQLRAYAEAAAAQLKKGDKGDPGDVSSVNGVKPDAKGNVQLDSDDVGALSKNGGKLSNDLYVERSAYPTVRLNNTTEGSQAFFQNTGHSAYLAMKNVIDDAEVYRALIVSDSDARPALKEALRLFTPEKTYDIFGVHNKPSGEYVGTGDATAQTIFTGAIGNMAIICGNGKFVIVTAGGGYCSDGLSLASSSTKMSGGSLVVSTASEYVNKVGVTYRYLVP